MISSEHFDGEAAIFLSRRDSHWKTFFSPSILVPNFDPAHIKKNDT
jgi:hypothetical protein